MSIQRCAHVVSGVVVNVIVADPMTFSYDDGSLVVPCPNNNIGDTYANGAFVVNTTLAPNQIMGLDFLQFMNLFTPTEQTMIFASNDTQTKMFITMAAGSGGLDLNNSQVVAGVNYLASINLIASNRVSVVLSGVPQS